MIWWNVIVASFEARYTNCFLNYLWSESQVPIIDNQLSRFFTCYWMSFNSSTNIRRINPGFYKRTEEEISCATVIFLTVFWLKINIMKTTIETTFFCCRSKNFELFCFRIFQSVSNPSLLEVFSVFHHFYNSYGFFFQSNA